MIRSIQKIIKIGSSGGVTIPAKELKQQNLAIGDEVEVIVRPVNKVSAEDQKVLDAAKATLDDFTWIVGHWQGTGLGGESEEMWMPPAGGAIRVTPVTFASLDHPASMRV